MAFVKSLRAKVLLAAVVPTVIVLVVVALIAFYAYQQVTRDVVKQRDTELAKISAARLAEGLSTHIQDLKNATAMDDVQSLEPARLSRALEAVQGRLNVFDAGVVVYNSEGGAVWPPTVAAAGRRFPTPSELETVRRTRGPAFSNVFVDQGSGEEVVLAAVPIIGSDNEFKGVLAGMATLKSSLLSATYA